MSDQPLMTDQLEVVSLFVRDKATGRLKYKASVPAFAFAMQARDDTEEPILNTLADGDDYSAFYAPAADSIVPRPSIEPNVSKTTLSADGIDAVTIDALPDPCRLAIGDADEQEIVGGTVTLRTEQPGTFLVRVAAWPAMDWTVTLEAA